MEQKHVLMSALGLGLGVGVGLGIGQSKWAGGAPPTQSSGMTPERVAEELMRMVVDGRDSSVTFEEFPYYLSEQTRVLLTSAAFVHLQQADFSKHMRNLSPASRTILLSGPTESYQQMLAKGLAHFFGSKLLLLDISDFGLRIQSKFGAANKESSMKRSISETTLERMSGLFESFSMLSQGEGRKGSLRRQNSSFDMRDSEGANRMKRLRRNASASADMSNLAQFPPTSVPSKRTGSWPFDEKLLIQSLYKVLVSVSKAAPIVLYIRDIDSLLLHSQRIYSLFERMLQNLSGPVLILGSRKMKSDSDSNVVDERLSVLFPYNIEIKPPEDENQNLSWKSQLDEDMKMMQYQDNRNHIAEVLAANDIDCDDLGSICLADAIVLGKYIDEIVVSAVSYHLMKTKNPEYRNGKLVISTESLSHGLSIFQGSKHSKNGSQKEANVETSKEAGKGAVPAAGASVAKPEAPVSGNKSETEKPAPVAKADVSASPLPPKATEVAPDNEFEKRIRPEVIPASEIGVTFEDIGALDDIKESLQELVMLPLRRPDLFKGGLLKPCRGILLFGPPGTGKTMLAKAIANEAGASFINASMSAITSKWFGEDEKNVRALFTLAAKISPTIIFVDEVDSMLGQRTRVGEHEAMRKIKNEFMTQWDGLLTKPEERILVLAATNRPFDLDEAIIRRFERRIMVGLPSTENRELILKTLLSKEKVDEGLDYKELATMTEGYSGSDLKNFCTTAAYRPVRELIQRERLKELEKKKREDRGEAPEALENKEEAGKASIYLRPLNMEDMKQAKKQVAASFAASGSIMSELKQWNDLYGEGGSRKKEQLTYFL
ncbi:uncharacterized protein A4U43_C01F14490 [Asparagus officinalis]|uniref:AAA+ ATPase domain-containing protein n=1 Tax=Asparagus officinalis TaxID=4686 RepID=A0A5P1FPB7_ASPOF|nr:uncharacterized protein A4U43_C01F14490 [Asparagus officinalis]